VGSVEGGRHGRAGGARHARGAREFLPIPCDDPATWRRSRCACARASRPGPWITTSSASTAAAAPGGPRRPVPRAVRGHGEGARRRAPPAADRWTLVFQSRFGPEAWLQPYADVAVPALAARARRVLVTCPGFAAPTASRRWTRSATCSPRASAPRAARSCASCPASTIIRTGSPRCCVCSARASPGAWHDGSAARVSRGSLARGEARACGSGAAAASEPPRARGAGRSSRAAARSSSATASPSGRTCSARTSRPGPVRGSRSARAPS